MKYIYIYIYSLLFILFILYSNYNPPQLYTHILLNAKPPRVQLPPSTTPPRRHVVHCQQRFLGFDDRIALSLVSLLL